MATLTHADIGKKVTFLYGPKGYGEGVLISLDTRHDQARVKATKVRDTASCTWRKTTLEVNVCARHVQLR